MKRRWSVSITLLMVFALLFGGVTTATAEPTFVRVSGRAVDANTGASALGVGVAVYVWHAPSGAWMLYGDALADDTGRFSLDVETNDQRTIVVLRGGGGYYDQVYRGVPVTLQTHNWASEMPNSPELWAGTPVDASQPVTLGDIPMSPRAGAYGAVTGRVVEQFGNPLAPLVRVWRQNPDTSDWSPTYWSQANQAGFFTFVGTPQAPLTGKVKIEFEYVGSKYIGFWGGGDLSSARALDIRPGDWIHGVNCQVLVPNRIHGHVMLAESKAPGAGFAVENHSARGIGGGLSKSDGSYVVSEYGSLPADDYKVLSRDFHRRYYDGKWLYLGQTFAGSQARVVRLADGDVLGNNDIWFSKVPAVAGKIVNQFDAPLPDITAHVYRVRNGQPEYVGSDMSDSRGMYRVLCGTPGSYTVRFVDTAGTVGGGDDRSVWLGGAGSFAGAKRLSVPAGLAAVAPPHVLMPVDGRASRIYGMDDCQAAIAVSKDTYASGSVPAVVLASQAAFADALSGSNVAAAVQGPVLLTRRDDVPFGLMEELDRLGARKIYLMGGEATISLRQEKLWGALGFEVERIAGADRYAVNANSAIAARSIGGAKAGAPAFVTSGDVFADALAVAPVVFANKGVVVLTRKAVPSPAVVRATRTLGITQLLGVGGPASLTSTAIKGFSANGVAVTRVASGADRYDTAARLARWAVGKRLLDVGHAGLATGTTFQDALVAGPAAGSTRSALLLTAPTALPKSTASALTALHGNDGTTKVSVYGNTSKISSKVLIQAGSR